MDDMDDPREDEYDARLKRHGRAAGLEEAAKLLDGLAQDLGRRSHPNSISSIQAAGVRIGANRVRALMPQAMSDPDRQTTAFGAAYDQSLARGIEKAVEHLEYNAAIFRAGATGPYDSAIRVADVLIEQAAAIRAPAEKEPS